MRTARWMLARTVLTLVICFSSVAVAWAEIGIIDLPDAWDLEYDDKRGLLYISTESGTIARYDVGAQAFLAPIEASSFPLHDLSISPDRSKLIVVENRGDDFSQTGIESGLVLVDLDSLETSQIRKDPADLLRSARDAEYSSDGSLLVTTLPVKNQDRDAVLRRYDFSSGRFTTIDDLSGNFEVAVSPDGESVLALGTRHREPFYLYVGTAAPYTRATSSRTSPRFLTDSKQFVIAGGNAPQVWSFDSIRGNDNDIRHPQRGTNTDQFFSLTVEFGPLSNRVYSTWQSEFSAAVIVHQLDDPQSAQPVFLGILDASFRFPSVGALTTDQRFFGNAQRPRGIQILPDESQLFVVTQNAVRIYDPNEFGDLDGDGLAGLEDNCPHVSNPAQEDLDGSNVGNACNDFLDPDGDDLEGRRHDNCVDTFNPDQADTDRNRIGDACNDFEDRDGDDWRDEADNCPDLANDQADLDNDRIGDACDPFPADANHELAQLRTERDLALSENLLLVAEVLRLGGELDLCRMPPDEDQDGVENQSDQCAATEAGAIVDEFGCSGAQFCESITLNSWRGFFRCYVADWSGSTDRQRDCRPRRLNARYACGFRSP